MQFTSTTGETNRNTIHNIMTANPLVVISGQSSTDTMNNMTDQMEKWSPPSKHQHGGGKHEPLALVLDYADYCSLTIDQSATTNRLDPPTTTVITIIATSTPFEITTFQDKHKKLQNTYEMQEVVTDIGIEQIFASVNNQYIE